MTGASATQTTIVVPVWDAYVAGFLSHTLSSLKTQHAATPIVVVDNASRTGLPELNGVHVVRAPVRLTLGEARNLGLAQVETPYVVFWDADDEMLPATLAFLEAAITSDPRLAAFATAIAENAPDVRHRWPRPWISVLVRLPTLFALVDAVWSVYPSTGATIMRTQLVREASGFGHADSGEDWCLGVSLAFRGRIGWSERPGRVYNLDAGSVWARHMTARHQLLHAAAVRQRIRQDPGIPSWARAMLPAIAVTQWATIGAHLVVAAVRRVR